MAAMNETVYIKGDKNVEVTSPEVSLGQVVKIECGNPEIVPKLKALKLLKFVDNPKKEKKKGRSRTVVSVLKVIECIHEQYPNIEVQNMGEKDMIVTYENQHTPGGMVHAVKVVCVVLITFVGAAFSIMAFNNDVDTTKLFGQIYELLAGRPSDGFTMLELSYCIGLVIGILVFFNHFGKKRFSVDPTPMEVEMRLYENDIETTLVETYGRRGKSWMWGLQIVLAVIGLSAGITVAGGLFSFISGLGVISDFADRTHTGEHILLYEDATALGGILGNIFIIYQIEIPCAEILLPVFGILAGIFVGCWAMALAEMLNVFPIFVRRAKLIRCIPWVILGMALGKGIGAFLFFFHRW